jgi:signal transduction histidine kinase/DNA-binding response OmpR family regulator/Tfp pilus assembly protein PilF
MGRAGIIFFILSIFLCAPSSKIDSLQNTLLQEGLSIEQKIDLLNTLGKELAYSEPASTEKYGIEALELAKKTNDILRIGSSYSTIGASKYITGNTDSALHYFLLANEIFGKNGSAFQKYDVLNNIGITYINLSQYTVALEYLLESLRIAEMELGEKETIRPLMNIGLVHDYVKEFDKAIEYYEKSIALAQKHDNLVVLRSGSNNLATLYKEIGDLDKALEFHRKALEAGLASGNKHGVGVTYNNLGVIYKNLDMYDSAKFYYSHSLDIKKELNDQFGLISLYINIGILHQQEKLYDSAFHYYTMAREMSEKVNSPEKMINVYKNFSSLYETIGDFENSLGYFKMFVELRDSIFAQEKSRLISELQVKFEAEKKEAEIALLHANYELQNATLKRQKTSKNLIAIGSAFTILLILTAFQRYHHYQSIKLLEAEKIRDLDRIKTNFFTNISHEFRTPLTLISGSLDKLIKNINLDNYPFAQQEFTTMKMNNKRILQLINQLLDLSKLDAGKEKLRASKGDIIGFVKRLFVSFASYADQKDITLAFNGAQVSAPSGHMGIYAYFDQEKVEKIFYNLISNAVKFTPPGGKISIDIFLSQDKYEFLEIRISNTGEGIPADKLAYIFDRFYQVEDNLTRKFEGSGIGLSLVKELVELHRGEITVESRENETTTFIVKLPLGKNHLAAEEIMDETVGEVLVNSEPVVLQPIEVKENGEAEMVGDTEETLVLIVEDHDELRRYIRDNLAHQYRVLEAENGRVGMEKAETHIPDLVITDVMMPEMDGFTLCRLLKQNEKTDHLPVILLTAKATVEDKLEGLEYGADDYLLKPFNSDELQMRVKNLIRSRKKLRDKFTSELFIKPRNITVQSVQSVFLEKLMMAIDKNMSDEHFGVEELGHEIGMSRAQLHRKIKALTNQSPSELIRNFRLQRAAEMIEQDAGNMAEIAYRVGFNSQAYFTRSFHEYFKCSPREYKKKVQI